MICCLLVHYHLLLLRCACSWLSLFVSPCSFFLVFSPHVSCTCTGCLPCMGRDTLYCRLSPSSSLSIVSRTLRLFLFILPCIPSLPPSPSSFHSLRSLSLAGNSPVVLPRVSVSEINPCHSPFIRITMSSRDQSCSSSSSDESSEASDYGSSAYTDLHLCDGDLDAIPARYLTPCPGFYHPSGVTHLDLSRNQFTSLTGISVFTNLVSLDVSNNGLTQLPAELALCTRLQSLSARNNLIQNLPKSLSALTELTTINFSGNRLQTFPDVVLSMHSLRYLYLGANEIEALPYSIGLMTRLSVLYLGGNKLKEIPATIGCLKNLVNLSLCDNELETIPATVAELQNLNSLSLHNNQIRTLPTEIVNLRDLQQLSLRNNPLVHNFVHHMSFEPPSLKEMAGRLVRRHHDMHTLVDSIPIDLIQYLASANHCVNPKCSGVYFEACVEHVKFVDFCGKYRVPLLQFLCSGKCAKRASSVSDQSSSSEDESDNSASLEVPQNNERMRRVLLG